MTDLSASADALAAPHAETLETLAPNESTKTSTHEFTPNQAQGEFSGVPGTETKAADPASPSGSISSLLSSDSTKKFIKSLSMSGLSTNGHIVTSPVLPSNMTPPESPVLPKNEKKPIKFTVRKVSRDTISIPEAGKQQRPREYAYGNLPENREKGHQRKPSDKVSQLQQQQAKYDLYARHVEKINKEVRFLTNLLPPYNVEIDYATRTKITRAIEKLRMKQDEIEKKKYTLGISISRLWREYDENDTWVRTVSKQ